MKHVRILWVSFFVLLLDQVTKYAIKTNMALHESIPVIGDFLRLTYVENYGMAFGISFGENKFFTVFAVIASVAILVYLFKMKSEFYLARFSMALIFGGALGNLMDRILRGRVVDFIDGEFFNIRIPSFKFLFLDFPGYRMDRWPVYNVADIAVTVGMVLLMIFMFLFDNYEQETELTEETEMIR